jgi:hypothetical protein
VLRFFAFPLTQYPPLSRGIVSWSCPAAHDPASSAPHFSQETGAGRTGGGRDFHGPGSLPSGGSCPTGRAPPLQGGVDGVRVPAAARDSHVYLCILDNNGKPCLRRQDKR